MLLVASMLKVKTVDEYFILMRAWRRNLSSVLAAFALIVGIIPIFLKTEVDYYFIPIFKIVLLTSALALLIILIFKKEREDRKYLIPLAFTLLLFLLTEIHIFVSIFDSKLNFISVPNYPLYQIFINLHYLFAMIPLYALMITQMRKTEQYAPRRLKLASLFITIF
ncbi:MAG: hypothetical protein HeimAB125_18340, partial [Candidatus Heimdallarchaeota archaeon AB_125]